jgi:L-amino acid N-acyltransferase YncA
MSSMLGPVIVRRATNADAAACLAIYRPFVEATAGSFEAVVPTIEELAARIEKSLSVWTWLIAEKDGRCIGTRTAIRIASELRTGGQSR